MDEVLPSQNQIGDSAIESPISNMGEELDTAAEFVIKLSRTELLLSLVKKATAPKIEANEDGSGLIHVPSDLVRFIRLQLSDWHRPVDKLITQHDPEYLKQRNKFVRGTIYKPVGVLVAYTESDSNQAIEYYSTQVKKPVIKEFSYIPETKAENMPNMLIDSVIWMTASRALSILRYSIESAFANEQALASINSIQLGLHKDG